MEKWPEKYPVVFSFCPPHFYLVATSKTHGYQADLGMRVRYPETSLAQIFGMTGDEFEELPEYDYTLIPEIEALPVEGPPK